MKWIITEDHTENGPATWSCMGMTDSTEQTRVIRAESKKNRVVAVSAYIEGHGLLYEFQLFDDDGDLCLTGRCGDITDCSGDLAFAPLDQMAGYTGCTELRYRKFVATNEWETL